MKFRPIIYLVVVLLSLIPACSKAQIKPPETEQKLAEAYISLPSGWQPKPPPIKNAVQFAVYRDRLIYFELVLEPKMDFSDNLDLLGWAKLVKENSAKESTLENRKDTELRKRTVGGREILEYEVTGELRGMKFHYRNIMLQSGDKFCKLVCWTVPSQWEEAQAKFDELVSNLK